MLTFLAQIYVYADRPSGYRKVYTCDTLEQASLWIEQHGVPESRRAWDYSIDGTPEAWHEQTGQCGGSSICDCD